MPTSIRGWSIWADGPDAGSPVAEDILENTRLRDAMENAAYVTRSLLS